MLVDSDGSFYFLEVNSRLQVEHTVTEEVLGLDLVACQLQIASGDALGFDQDDITQTMRGHSIECRINAEDARRNFLPAPGTITRYSEPNGLGVRLDSGYEGGDTVPEAYDSLVAKLITWGNDREEARTRMLRALDELVLEGIETSIPAHQVLLEEKSFVEGTHTTRTIEGDGVLEGLAVTEDVEQATNVLLVQGRAVKLWNPAMAASASAAVQSGGTGDLIAPMQGTILKVLAKQGDTVEAGEAVVVLEAMKMETTIAAPSAGTITELPVNVGDSVGAGQVVAVIE